MLQTLLIAERLLLEGLPLVAKVAPRSMRHPGWSELGTFQQSGGLGFRV